MRLQNNTDTFRTWTAYVGNMSNLQRFSAKLSSGLINPPDNPAAVGISARLSSAFGSTFMAIQNVDNGISAAQTANSWTGQINESLSRMKALSVKYGDGTLSAGDRINMEVEFKYLQREITRISSRNTAAAKFNGEPLLQGGSLDIQAGDTVDQKLTVNKQNLSDTNSSNIGDVVTYDAAGTAVRTPVAWNSIIDDVNGLQIGDALATGKLDVAINYVSKGMAQNASDLKRLRDARDGLLEYAANLNESATKIGGVDMAFESSQAAVSQVLVSADISVMTQGASLDAALLSSLFQAA